MSAVLQPVKSGSPAFCVATIRGRVESSRKRDQARYTSITTPASDEYSRPQTLEVRSKPNELIGSAGDEVTIRVKIGGYAKRPRPFTDKATGEMRTINEVVHTLDLVEAE